MGHNSRKPIPEWAQPAGLAAALQVCVSGGVGGSELVDRLL